MNAAWLYYKVYVGSRVDAFNWILMNHIAPLSELKAVKKWFFIRYVDDLGPHLRIRFLIEIESKKDMEWKLYEKLHDATTRLATLPQQATEPLIRVQGVSQFKRFKNFPVRARKEPYIPEEDIYGKGTAMEIAENLFFRSSELAINIIRKNHDFPGLKKTIAPIMMNEAIDLCPVGRSKKDFTDFYSNYWLNGAGNLRVSKSILQEKYFDLEDMGYDLLNPNSQPTELHELVSEWKSQLKNTFNSYRRNAVVNKIQLERISFYFIHLMNNRLGFTPIEEAYLAILLSMAAD